MTKQQEFNSYYVRKHGQIKWFEPYIQPKMLDEWNNKVIREGMRLLDVGGGCSLDSIFYSTNGVNTVVLDYASNAVKKLKKMADFYGVNVECEEASILDVPDRLLNSFDVITVNGCFHHIDPEDRVRYVKFCW